MHSFKSRWKDKYWIYILIHAVLFLLGALIVQFDRGWADAVGYSILSTGIAGWVVFIYVYVSDDIRSSLDLMREYGFVGMFEARSSTIRIEYDSRLSKASNSIDIMGFGLRHLREDYSKDFKQWSQRAHVRILLLDPAFPSATLSYASQRELEERNPEGSVLSDVQEFVKVIHEQFGGMNTPTFQVRLYQCLPSINVLRIDSQVFWGPYLMHRQSRNTPTFVVERGGKLYDHIVTHFDAIWHDDELSRSVPSDFLEHED